MAKRHGTMLFTLAPAAAATPAPGALISNLRQHREVPMRRKHFAMSLLGSFAIAAGLLFPIAARCPRGCRFRDASATRNGPSVTGRLADRNWLRPDVELHCGLLVWASAAIHGSIDPGETVIFSFARPASNVRLTEFAGAVHDDLTQSTTSGASTTATLPDGSAFCWISPESSILIRCPDVELTNFGSSCNNGHTFRRVNRDYFDSDDDGVSDDVDNCRGASPIPTRLDTDGDGAGDACDADDDNDDGRGCRRQLPARSEPGSGGRRRRRRGRCLRCRQCRPRQRRRAGQCRPLRADARGQVVNAEGCAIAQICPCEGPWQNRVAYVACVARTGNDFRKDGLISARELVRIVLEAGKSRCGARSGELAGPD